VDVPDRRRTKGFALVRLAPSVAGMTTTRPVIDLATLAVAMRTAPAQLEIQGVEHFGVDAAGFLLADERRHVKPHVQPVIVDGGLLTLELVEVLVQQLTHRGVGARGPACLDVGHEPGATTSVR
jgi:hypothetical protein